MTDPAFQREQRGVGVRMAVALFASILLIGAAVWFGSDRPLAARLETVAASALATLAWLIAGIGNVARIRFVSPDDIAGGGRTQRSTRVRDAAAILQNTLEQVVIAIPVQVAAAVVITRSTMLLGALAVLFSIGRLLFWRGYARGASARALGFALTFYPTVIAFLLVAVALMLR